MRRRSERGRISHPRAGRGARESLVWARPERDVRERPGVSGTEEDEEG